MKIRFKFRTESLMKTEEGITKYDPVAKVFYSTEKRKEMEQFLITCKFFSVKRNNAIKVVKTLYCYSYRDLVTLLDWWNASQSRWKYYSN